MYKDNRFAIFLFTFGLLSIILIGWLGHDYYFLPLAEKYKSVHHEKLGPSGIWGHGLGVIGSIIMLLNFLYSWRKRNEFNEKLGSLKHWLEFHMFVGLFGPILIIYHSVFKFQGIIATICFFSLVIVVISGIIGRYIYVQVPHNISGLELSLAELELENNRLTEILRTETQNDPVILKLCEEICGAEFNRDEKKLPLLVTLVKSDLQRRKHLNQFMDVLKEKGFSRMFLYEIMGVARQKAITSRRINLWESTHKLLDTWRIIHKKLSWLLFITLTIHVLVTILFGFTWVF